MDSTDVARSLAQQEEYRVRDTDGDRDPGGPVTEAGGPCQQPVPGGADRCVRIVDHAGLHYTPRPGGPYARSGPATFWENDRGVLMVGDVLERLDRVEAALLARRAPGDRDRVADALREAYTLLVSATPALIRDAKQAERPGALPEYRRRSALLRDKVDEWLVPYREHFDQGLAVLRADSRPEQPADGGFGPACPTCGLEMERGEGQAMARHREDCSADLPDSRPEQPR